MWGIVRWRIDERPRRRWDNSCFTIQPGVSISFGLCDRVYHTVQFGYSFMLHFYSSPLTHLVKPEGLPSRPDVNVIFTIYVPLLQVRELLLLRNMTDTVSAFHDPFRWGKTKLVQ